MAHPMAIRAASIILDGDKRMTRLFILKNFSVTCLKESLDLSRIDCAACRHRQGRAGAGMMQLRKVWRSNGGSGLCASK
jgi:hypothetical protein